MWTLAQALRRNRTGDRTRERAGELAAGRVSDRAADRRDVALVLAGRRPLVLLVAVVALLLLPRVLPAPAMAPAVLAVVYAVAVMGLNLLMGYCGQISVAQSGFMAIGGFLSVSFQQRLGLNPWLALVLATLVAGVVGLVFGLPAVRVRGLYLALISIAAEVIIEWAVVHLDAVTGGASGLIVEPYQVGGVALLGDVQFYYFALAVAAVLLFVSACVARGRLGRAFAAIRDNEAAAASMGISVPRYKLAAFFLCCCYAGVSGALLVHYIGVASSSQFTLNQSVWLLAMLLVGGSGTLLGPVLGAVLIGALQYGVSTVTTSITHGITGSAFWSALPTIVVGLVLLACLGSMPAGVTGALAGLWRRTTGASGGRANSADGGEDGSGNGKVDGSGDGWDGSGDGNGNGGGPEVAATSTDGVTA